MITNFYSKINKIEKIINNEANSLTKGISAYIYNPDNNMSIGFASGYSDFNKKIKLKTENLFRIASVTKTFIASTILRLHEENLLNIENSIANYLPIHYITLLHKGDYNSSEITIKHLLSHSSGLFDHTNTDKFNDLIKHSPNYKWSRFEQVETCIKYGNKLNEPGKAFNYSDTGYILLGKIVEIVAELPLAEAVRKFIDFNNIDLLNTTWESEENINRIHQYLDDNDTFSFNPSFDLYGGGGLLSNCKELAFFFYSLFNGKVFKQSSTLTTMLSKNTYAVLPELDYRYGIFRIEVNGIEGFTHTGFWGTQAIYFPAIKTSIAINYSEKWKIKGNAPILPKILEIILA